MRLLATVLLLASACADDDGGPGVSSRVEHKEIPLGTLGVACFDGPLLDTDAAIAGIQPGCSATLASGGAEPEVVPACGSGRTPCFRIEAHAACAQTVTMLAVFVDPDTAGATLTIECVLEE